MSKHRRADPPSSADLAALDRLLDRFDQAWQAGKPPALADFLPVGFRGRRQALRELVKIDLENRWRRPAPPEGRGKGGGLPARPRLEDYVARLPRLGPPDRLPVELIGEEYRARQRWGDRPGHAEYARRFPRHGPALRAELARIDAELRDETPTVYVRGPGDDDKSLSSLRVAARSPDHAITEAEGAERGALIRCPHCRQSMEAAADRMPRDLACPACGGAFGVESLSAGPGGAARPPFRRLGRYELGDLLGTGTFGSVWRAWDTELGREVAVKLPRSGRFSGPAEEERFLREARSAAQLHHPGVVAVHDVGRDHDTLYIVSELVQGVSLAERLAGGRLSFREAAELIAQVSDALAYAHRQGVVHRDVKPSNILLSGEGRGARGERREAEGEGLSSLAPRPSPLAPRLMDFGLALRDAGEVTMTTDGQVLGTPAYMSPEQVRNPHAVDGRSDVYSLGVILYELLTGGLPFRGMTRMLLAQVVAEEPRPPRRLNDKIPRDLETVCLKCLRKEPRRRYQAAAALAADLRRWLAGEPITARPVGWAERLWLWARRNRALVAAAGLGAVALTAVTGAPAAAVLVAVAAASLLLALYKTRAAAELTQAAEDAKASQKKTAAALQFAMRHYAQARAGRRRAESVEAEARRRFNRLRALARAVIFDLPDRVADAPARALLVRTALAYLDGLADEAGDDAALRRELAVAYARAGDVQWAGADAAGALASHRKALDLFAALAAAHPGNAQARRDLEAGRGKVADLERARKAEGRGRKGE